VTKKLVIAMSGGTTSVINATLAGIIKKVQSMDNIRIYAGYPGITGILKESFIDVTDLPSQTLEFLYHTPASGFIGTTRVRPLNDIELKRLAEVFNAHNIRYFINVGGNKTIKQSIQISKKVSSFVSVAAVPKTVDNDLGDEEFKKVLYTPGFPSCANYWKHKTHIMNQENLGAYSHDKVLIAQTFGRKTGFLAGCARLADPERKMPLIILLPEDQLEFHEVLKQIEKTLKLYKRTMVILSEGYEVGDIGERYDPSGQVMYGSSQTTAAQILVNECTQIGIQARAFIPGIDQRSEIVFTTSRDLERAYNIGFYTAEKLIGGEKDFFSSIAESDTPGEKVEYISIPFNEIGDFSRIMPDKWISSGNFDVTDDYINYVEPLIGKDYPDTLIRGEKPNFTFPLKPSVEKKLEEWDENQVIREDSQ